MSEIETTPTTDSSNTNGTSSHTADSSVPASVHEPLLERIRAFTKEEMNRLEESVRQDVFKSFLSSFQKAYVAHEKLTLALGIDEEAPSISAADLRTYRNGVEELVLTPIRQQLKTSPIDELGNCYRVFFESLKTCISWGPDTQIVPEPQGLFNAHKLDGPWMLLRKFSRRRRRGFARAGHGVQNTLRSLVGKKRVPAVAYTQIVPVRQLLAYHFQVRLPKQVIPQFFDQHYRLAKYVACYENAQSAWIYALLDAELQLTQARYVLPELEPWIKENEDSSTVLADEKTIASLRQHVSALREALKVSENEEAEESEDRLDPTSTQLLHDLFAGGTFLLNPSERSVPAMSQRPAYSIYTHTQQWNVWYAEVNNRLLTIAALNDLRNFFWEGENRIFRSIASASLTPIFVSLSRLKTSLDEGFAKSNDLFDQYEDVQPLSKLAESIRPIKATISSKFRFSLNDLTGLLKAGQALEEPGASLWMRINDHVASLPEILSIHKPSYEIPFPGQIAEKGYQINLRESVQSALLQPLPPQLEQPARSLQKAVVRTWEETQQVEQMVEYNLSTAISELMKTDDQLESQTTSDAETLSETEDQDPFSAAKELVTTGLSRSADKLEELALGLNKPWKSFVDVVFRSLETYSDDIDHNVSAADNLHNRWLNLRVRVNRRWQHFGQELNARKEATLAWLNKVIRRGQRQTKQLIKKGQSAVGVVGQSEDHWLQTLQLVSDIETLHKRLPLVYRRLFSLKPLEELDLLEGRKLDLAFVKKHYDRWNKSLTGPLIMAMPYGSGRTSLMNVLSLSVFDDAEMTLIHLDRRFSDADEWAAYAAEVLEIPIEEPVTLDKLEERLMAQERGDKARVVMIDRLEHLLLCTPGGEKLIERILIFLSRTDNAIYWIANIGIHAWHFLEKTLKPSSGFISAYHVTQLQRQALEDIILKRHHRSGMSLQFKSTSAPSSFFDFSRSKDEESLQKAIQNTFFDRLYRLSGQNILLALLYWLRAVEFDPKNDTMLVNALEPINFSFLESLDLNRAFTLKSFLIHRTLTIEEHMRIFKTSRPDSTIILESLLNLSIIEPLHMEEHASRHFRITPNLPYRIHPLIVHPVTQFLKKLHIIY